MKLLKDIQEVVEFILNALFSTGANLTQLLTRVRARRGENFLDVYRRGLIWGGVFYLGIPTVMLVFSPIARILIPAFPLINGLVWIFLAIVFQILFTPLGLLLELVFDFDGKRKKIVTTKRVVIPEESKTTAGEKREKKEEEKIKTAKEILLKEEKKGMVKTYLERVSRFLFWGSGLSLLLAILPTENNPSMIPWLFLSSLVILFFILGRKETTLGTIIVILAGLILIASIVSFYTPLTIDHAVKWMEKFRNRDLFEEIKAVKNNTTENEKQNPHQVIDRKGEEKQNPVDGMEIRNRFGEFRLNNTPTPTIQTSPGSFYRISSDKDFYALSGKADGVKKFYIKKSTIWAAGDNNGVLYLQGIEPETKVNIQPVQ